MGNEYLRFLTEEQKRQLNNIIVAIQINNVIPLDKKMSEIQKATDRFLATLKAKGELKIPETWENGVLEGLMGVNVIRKPQTSENNHVANLGVYKYSGPIMLH